MPKEAKKKFLLVSWVEDQTVGVMPMSAVHKDSAQNIVAGSVIKVKWSSKYYEAEIIKISGK